jgi:NADH:ubiquinone oxidoreductase subunit K
MNTMSWTLAGGCLLMAIGLAVTMTRRTVVGMLLGIELMLSSSTVVLSGFAAGLPVGSDARSGLEAFVLMVIVLAAAEAAVALSLFLAYYRASGTADADAANELFD